jgi:hypothetical protein
MRHMAGDDSWNPSMHAHALQVPVHTLGSAPGGDHKRPEESNED